MSKRRPTLFQKAIQDIDDQISALELARKALLRAREAELRTETPKLKTINSK